jgi:hypothetical protein
MHTDKEPVMDWSQTTMDFANASPDCKVLDFTKISPATMTSFEVPPVPAKKAKNGGGKASRDKGKKGQREFKKLLDYRGWTYMESRAGAKEEDVLAISPEGVIYSVEVKNTLAMDQGAHVKQAQRQAAERGKKARWMVAWAVDGLADTFVVRTQGAVDIWRLGVNTGL